jgi:26S proteasome regulatory subunit T6
LRFEAQINDLNEKVMKLSDESYHLLKSWSQIVEIIQILDKDKVLVKTSREGEYIVIVDKKINIEDLRPSLRVTLGSGWE